MKLRGYMLQLMMKWWWLILLATAVAGAASYWNVSKMPKVYQTYTTLAVGQFLESADPRLGDFNTSQQLAQVYAQTVRRQPLLQATIDALQLKVSWQALAVQVNALAPAGTQLIQIGVVDTDPVRAKIIADEIANQLILQSPTSQEKEREEQRQFISEQMSGLEVKIRAAEKQVTELEGQIERETSAVGIRNIQDRVTVLQQQIGGWQATYSRLLDFYRVSRTNYLTVIDQASVPSSPIGPNVMLNVLLAAAAGFALAVGAALLMVYLDDALIEAEDVKRSLGLPIIGTIAPFRKPAHPSDNLVGLDRQSPIYEAYRGLRTNVQLSYDGESTPMFLVTSPGPQEGKSVTAANLALSFAWAGKQTILVDADLHRPTIHRFFGAANVFGLTSLFAAILSPRQDPRREEAKIPYHAPWRNEEDPTQMPESCLMPTGHPNLRLLLSGPLPGEPGDILASPRLDQFLSILRGLADVIVMDSPPLLAAADPTILAAKATGVVVVVEVGKTRVKAAHLANEALRRAKAPILGVVLNKAPGGSNTYYRQYAKAANRTAYWNRQALRRVIPSRFRARPFLWPSQLVERVNHLVERVNR